MRAIILETYRKYCILMTEDGQFLRKDIPAGQYEIGDEIIIDRFEEIIFSKRKKLFVTAGRAVAGFAVVTLIVTGLYFGVKFLRNYIALGSSAAIAQATLMERSLEVYEDSSALEPENAFKENISGEGVAEGAEETGVLKEQPTGTSPQENKLFEGSYSLENAGVDIPISFANMNIIYRVDEAEKSLIDFLEKERKLNFNFKNINEKVSFNGNVDINLLNKDLDVTRTHIIPFDDFGSDQEKS